MEIMILLIFIGIVLVAAALLLFVWTLNERTFDHTDRLALLPLEDDHPSTSLKKEETGRRHAD